MPYAAAIKFAPTYYIKHGHYHVIVSVIFFFCPTVTTEIQC